MAKRGPFTVRLSGEVEGWLDRESKRLGRSKGALLEALADEAIRTRRFPGIAFRGDESSRRPWVVGTGLDVWEVVDLYRGKGKERLLEEHNVSERLLDLALAYRESYPEEIDQALEENSRSPEYWMERYPGLRIKVREF